MHEVDLSKALYFAEGDFLAALKSGTKTLASWHQTWSALQDSASDNGTTCNETSLVHFVASRISSIASCYLDVKHEEESFTSQLHNDCDDILHQMNTLNLNAHPKSSHFASASRPTQSGERPSHLFFASVHQWLVDNLHNPYPTAELKAYMAATSSCPVSSINYWFINARRRIGWATLCREHFSNSRAGMLDAAYRALVEEDPRRPLSAELRHSFIAMKTTVEGLYSSALVRGTLSGDLDAIIQDMTEKNGESAGAGEGNNMDIMKAVRNSHTSPDVSIGTSLVSDFLTKESEQGEIDAPPTTAGSKRRWSSIESVEQPSTTASQPVKRPRASTAFQMSLPSPPLSTRGVDELCGLSSPELSFAHSDLPSKANNALLPRQQRLSVADTISKWPSDSMTALLPYAALDPLSPGVETEYSIDDWFKSNFDDLFAIPPPVDATQPDFSVSWEVALFTDYDIPVNLKCTPKCPLTPDADVHIPTRSNLSSHDGLLQPIGSDTSITPSASMLPSSTASAHYITSIDASLIDIDWTSLLDGTEVHRRTTHSSFHQHPDGPRSLSEIDLSILRFPQVMPAAPSSDFASKQAKLHRLHTMQEEVWRMEQELRSEGVVT